MNDVKGERERLCSKRRQAAVLKSEIMLTPLITPAGVDASILSAETTRFLKLGLFRLLRRPPATVM
jgi:hypothetical protein